MKLPWFIAVVLLTQHVLSKKAKPTERSGRQSSGVKTVISCRVFQKGICKPTNENIIQSKLDASNPNACQLLCYSTSGCAAFTFFWEGKERPRKCILFRDCNGKRTDCNNCVSGPIMPRINECLSGKQELDQDATSTNASASPSTCTAGCTTICIGPDCPDLERTLDDDSSLPSSIVDIDTASDADYDLDVDDLLDNETSTGEAESEVDYVEDYYDENDDDEDEVDEDDEKDLSYDDTDDDSADAEEVKDEEETDYYDESFDYNSAEDQAGVEDSEDNDLSPDPEVDLERVEDEVDVSVDDGFLMDNNQRPVTDFPVSPAITSRVGGGQTGTGSRSTAATVVFMFCAVGGKNAEGLVSAIEVLTASLQQVAQALFKIPQLPSRLTRGGKALDLSTSVTDDEDGVALTTCSSGYTTLTAYGLTEKPGSCAKYSFRKRRWSMSDHPESPRRRTERTTSNRDAATPGKSAIMKTPRQGGTVTRLEDRYLVSAGGRNGRGQVTDAVEIYDTQQPLKGWRRSSKMRLPAKMSDHCSLVHKSGNKTSLILIGGKEKGNRVLKFDMTLKKWYSLNRLTRGRYKHSCMEVSLNGRPGVLVSGGQASKNDLHLSSVEFYDLKSGRWLLLPRMRKGRSQHSMTISKGRLLVAGGTSSTKNGSLVYRDDIEVFTGKKWMTMKTKLARPMASFSLLKIPRSAWSNKRGGIPGKNEPTHGDSNQASKTRYYRGRAPRRI